jgi:hypothetical protein
VHDVFGSTPHSKATPSYRRSSTWGRSTHERHVPPSREHSLSTNALIPPPRLHAAPWLGAAAHLRLRLPELRLLPRLAAGAALRAALRVARIARVAQRGDQPLLHAVSQREDLLRLQQAAVLELVLRERQGPGLVVRLAQQNLPFCNRGGPEPVLYAAPPLAALGGGGLLRARQTACQARSTRLQQSSGIRCFEGLVSQPVAAQACSLTVAPPRQTSVYLRVPLKHSQEQQAALAGTGCIMACSLCAHDTCRQRLQVRAAVQHVSQRSSPGAVAAPQPRKRSKDRPGIATYSIQA